MGTKTSTTTMTRCSAGTAVHDEIWYISVRRCSLLRVQAGPLQSGPRNTVRSNVVGCTANGISTRRAAFSLAVLPGGDPAAVTRRCKTGGRYGPISHHDTGPSPWRLPTEPGASVSNVTEPPTCRARHSSSLSSSLPATRRDGYVPSGRVCQTSTLVKESNGSWWQVQEEFAEDSHAWTWTVTVRRGAVGQIVRRPNQWATLYFLDDKDDFSVGQTFVWRRTLGRYATAVPPYEYSDVGARQRASLAPFWRTAVLPDVGAVSPTHSVVPSARTVHSPAASPLPETNEYARHHKTTRKRRAVFAIVIFDTALGLLDE
jgi:hypothetical protein